MEKVYEERLRSVCREARHVLTHIEAEELEKEGVLPGWTELQRIVGPWYLWSDMFMVPFASEKLSRVADGLKNDYLLKENDRKAAEARFLAKTR